MKLIVCVKQVPATTEVKMDPETNTIIREGIESIINPFDTYAIEEAVRIKEKIGGTITALSMGIPSVQLILQEAISLGVDEAFLLTDRAFAGADTLATAYALSKGVEKIKDFDLIICGKMATDGDTAQVGPSLAERLGLPHITDVSKIEKITDKTITCIKLLDNGWEKLECDLPALITVVKDINVPRLPSIQSIKKADNTTITMWSSDDVQADKNRLGLKGSPTQVVRTFVPIHDVKSEWLEGSATKQSKMLIDRLLSHGLF